jgi:hypothetical protein
MKEPRRPAREIASFFTDQAQSLAKPNTSIAKISPKSEAFRVSAGE